MNIFSYPKRKLKQLVSGYNGNVKTIPSHDFFTKLKEKGNLKLFQIFGVPRSGTTLLASIIDNHNNAICLIEPILSLQTQGSVIIDEKYQIGFREKQSLEDTFLLLSHKPNLKILGFKETYRTEFHHSFPSRSLIESNIALNSLDYHIAIIRDPRDGWASVVNRNPQFCKNRNAFKEYIYSWNSLCNLISFNENILAIRYEDLVSETERILLKVSHYLNISFPTNIFPLNGISGFGDETAQKGGGIFQSSTNYYNNYLSLNEISYVEKKCFDNLLRFGYSV